MIIFASLTRELFKIILFLGVKRYIFFFFFVKLKNEQFFGTSQKWNQKSKLRHPWGIVWTKNCTRSPVWIHLHFSVLTSNIYQFSQKFKFNFFFAFFKVFLKGKNNIFLMWCWACTGFFINVQQKGKKVSIVISLFSSRLFRIVVSRRIFFFNFFA